ncbi:hypothetical protein LIER_28990 [Lithospermum erythrorhizon]|uniref:Uncharacterized protein n=1 Tax=Lithospermum erythrorhizon TaxID=34254 RepID=A0AAV3RHQ7_LITER
MWSGHRCAKLNISSGVHCIHKANPDLFVHGGGGAAKTTWRGEAAAHRLCIVAEAPPPVSLQKFREKRGRGEGDTEKKG